MMARDHDENHLTTRCDCKGCVCANCGINLYQGQPYLCVPQWVMDEFNAPSHMYCHNCVAEHAVGCAVLEKLAS